MRSEHFIFEAEDGAEIFVYKWLPEEDKSAKAVVQISHGMAEHAARCGNWVSFCCLKSP